MKMLLSYLNPKNIRDFVEQRWGKKALLYLFLIWVAKWVVTIFFGAQIVLWFKGLF